MEAQTKAMFTRIAGSEPRFLEWLTSELEATNESLTFAQLDVLVRRAQGKAQFLRILIEHLTPNP